MKAIRRFTVRAVLPENLGALEELAGNLRWSWHEPTRQLFARISPELWQQTGHDPIALLGAVDPARLAELANDHGYVEWANRLRDDLHAYLSEPRWYQGLDDSAPRSIAYFSPEFGIAAALPQYSGGLGILAGDHLKSGERPRRPAGRCRPVLPFRLLLAGDRPGRLAAGELPGARPGRAAAGRAAQAGRHRGADHARAARRGAARPGLAGRRRPHPPPAPRHGHPRERRRLRSVTDRLYGGGGEHRLLQELLLGIGGVRAIKVWTELTGMPAPEVFHTNEGHAGFLGVERISDLIGEGLTFDEALQVVRAGTVFTTHTPVPAGIDRFERPLVERYFSTDLLPGVQVPDVLALGAEDYPGGSPDVFNMAVMGLRLGQHANGVSKLHGQVSRRMFRGLWPGFDVDEVPIDSVTNGVRAHLDGSDAPRARRRAPRHDDTTAADWAPAERRRPRPLVGAHPDARTARRRRPPTLRAAWEKQNPGGVAPAWMSDLLDPSVLTIGFARRVPTYKRLTLMLHDPDRLRAILLNPERPVQIVIAGKSHPADEEGKRLIQKLVQFAAEPDIRTRMVFLPDYDIGMAQLLYPGTDVWLNNPLRPLEACGTSGMKAALNGALNLSILDGWWNEYYDGENGWAIPSADAAGDGAERDALEAEALYDLIENQIAPRFYERNGDGVPEAWVGQIRHTLSTLSPALSATRMVREYVERLYVPASGFERRVSDDGYAGAAGSPPGRARAGRVARRHGRPRRVRRRGCDSAGRRRTAPARRSSAERAHAGRRRGAGRLRSQPQGRRAHRRPLRRPRPGPQRARAARRLGRPRIQGNGAARLGRGLRLHRARRAEERPAAQPGRARPRRRGVVVRYPRPLAPGDTIGVTASSSGVGPGFESRLDDAVRMLRRRGYEVVLGDCLRGGSHVSAPAAERAAELMRMLLDPGIRAVVPPWGGETAIDLLPLLDFDAHRRGRAHLVRRLLGHLDGADAAHPTDGGRDPAQRQPDRHSDAPARGVLVVARRRCAGRRRRGAPGSPTNGWRRLDDGVAGFEVSGRMIGGCIETLANVAGTPFGRTSALEATIVYVEAAEDGAYSICRNLHGMRLAGFFDTAVAVLIGRTKAPDSPTQTQSEAVVDALGMLGVPIVSEVEVGHVPPQLTVVNGAIGRLVWNDGERSLEQTLA